MQEAIPFIEVETKRIVGGDFTGYQNVLRSMVRRYPQMQLLIEENEEVDARVDVKPYLMNELLPQLKKGTTLELCEEWFLLTQTIIIGTY